MQGFYDSVGLNAYSSRTLQQMKGFLILVGVFGLGFSGLVGAESLKLESGEDRVHLLELFTSEGCSSCPPADRWLTTLKEDERLWEQFVPVAFHVDYWNYLGWSDRFSSTEHSKRQAALAAVGQFNVYTPGFVLDGNEWRSGLFGRQLHLADAEVVGNLNLEWLDPVARIRFAGLHQGGDVTLEAHVVHLGFDQHTRVKTGENHGKTLRHDFVVLAHEVVKLTHTEQGFVGQVNLPAVESLAIAAWVSPLGSPRPLQAIGGWIN
jgi:hypothetical protein